MSWKVLFEGDASPRFVRKVTALLLDEAGDLANHYKGTFESVEINSLRKDNNETKFTLTISGKEKDRKAFLLAFNLYVSQLLEDDPEVINDYIYCLWDMKANDWVEISLEDYFEGEED